MILGRSIIEFVATLRAFVCVAVAVVALGSPSTAWAHVGGRISTSYEARVTGFTGPATPQTFAIQASSECLAGFWRSLLAWESSVRVLPG